MNTTIIDSIKSSMVSVEGGTFMMGDLLNMHHPHLFSPEIIKVKVTLSDYHICNHLVTQAEWGAVMNETLKPSDAQLPVVGKSWHQVQAFIQELNKATKMNFRLPTEAEWEYAARGGEKSNGSIYAGNNVLDPMGWYKANSNRALHPVCQKDPNQQGIFDMSGNVWEWCQDIYERYYKLGAKKDWFSRERFPVVNPQGGIVGNDRVVRGGSYKTIDQKCWVFYRNKQKSTSSADDLGFRLAY